MNVSHPNKVIEFIPFGFISQPDNFLWPGHWMAIKVDAINANRYRYERDICQQKGEKTFVLTQVLNWIWINEYVKREMLKIELCINDVIMSTRECCTDLD